MNKSLGLLLAAALLIAPAAQAKEVISPVFEDFSTFTSMDAGDASKKTFNTYFDYQQNAGRITAEQATDGKYGKSMMVTMPKSGTTPFMNSNTQLNGNGVFGFSIYLNDSPVGRRVNGKDLTGQWMNSMFDMNYNKIYSAGQQVATYENFNWYDVRVAFQFDKQSYDMYINGKKVNSAPLTLKDSAKGIQYFNFAGDPDPNATRDSVTYFDNIVAYGESGGAFGATTSIDKELGAVDTSIQQITVDFNHEVLTEDITQNVLLQNAAGAPVEGVTVTPKMKAGYYGGAVLTLSQRLSPQAGYKIVLNGLSDMLGGTLNKEIPFTTIDDRPVLEISPETAFETLPAGVKVKFSLTAKNLGGFSKIEIYRNGEKTGETEIGADSFSVPVTGGKNEVYALAVGEASSIESNKAVLNGVAYNTLEPILRTDFSGQNIFDGFPNYGAETGTLAAGTVDQAHGTSLKFVGNGEKAPYVNAPNMDGRSGIAMAEAEFYWEDIGTNNRDIFPIKVNPGQKWFSPVKLQNSGSLILQDQDQKNLVLVDKVEAKKWYKIRIYYDFRNKDITVVVNDELAAYRIGMFDQSITDILYTTVNTGPVAPPETSTFYLDNVVIAMTAPEVTVSSPSEGKIVPYENSAIEITFSEAMNLQSVQKENIILLDAAGNPVAYDGTYSEADKRFTLTPTEALIPNTQYQIKFREALKSLNGGSVSAERIVEFLTEKTPFGLESFLMKQGGKTLAALSEASPGEEVTLQVKVRNRNAEQLQAKLAAGIYKQNSQLTGFNFVSVSGSEVGKTYTITVKAPADVKTGNYKIRLFLLDNFTELNVADTME